MYQVGQRTEQEQKPSGKGQTIGSSKMEDNLHYNYGGVQGTTLKQGQQSAFVKYASPFAETKQQQSQSPQNIQFQSSSHQNDTYSSPHFIKQGVGNSPNFLSAISSNKQNGVYTQNQTSQNQEQQYGNTQISQSSVNNFQMPSSVQTQAAQPVPQREQQLVYSQVNGQVNSQNLYTNSIPFVQSIITPTTLTSQTNQHVIRQQSQPVFMQQTQPVVMQQTQPILVQQTQPVFNTVTNTIPVQYLPVQLPQKMSYFVESKPILQTSQVRILSPKSQRLNYENDFSKPLFENKSPLSKRYEETNSQYSIRNESRFQFEERDRQYQGSNPPYLPPYQRTAQFEKLQSNERPPVYVEDRDISYLNRPSSFTPGAAAAEYNFQNTKYSSNLEGGNRTANFKEQQSYADNRPSYSHFNGSKVQFKDDIDINTRRVVENKLKTSLSHNRSYQSLARDQFDIDRRSSTHLSGLHESIQFQRSNLGARDAQRSQPYRQSISFLQEGRDIYERNPKLLLINPNHHQQSFVVEQSLKDRELSYMFEKRSTDFLKEYFQAIVDIEREVESHRIKIVKQEDYSIQLFYELFDINESGYVVIEELVQGLQKLGIQADQTDVQLLVQRYSLDKNTKLDQQEFINMVVPKTYQHIQSIFVRKPYVNEKNMRDDTRQLMSKIMKGLLNAEVVLESIRKKINQKQISIKELYTQMCFDPQDSINKQSLREYLVKIGIFINKEEIPQIMQRFDQRDMGFFRIQEFEVELKPRFI